MHSRVSQGSYLAISKYFKAKFILKCSRSLRTFFENQDVSGNASGHRRLDGAIRFRTSVPSNELGTSNCPALSATSIQYPTRKLPIYHSTFDINISGVNGITSSPRPSANGDGSTHHSYGERTVRKCAHMIRRLSCPGPIKETMPAIKPLRWARPSPHAIVTAGISNLHNFMFDEHRNDREFAVLWQLSFHVMTGGETWRRSNRTFDFSFSVPYFESKIEKCQDSVTVRSLAPGLLNNVQENKWVLYMEEHSVFWSDASETGIKAAGAVEIRNETGNAGIDNTCT
ncbi:hypothetical protein EV702DRAFT_1269462 [Suillus placidus]|uniref:Uncharacterized protein n=1 Tax=Suillus placidus TaxID=48579 RepID=A0A9P6ZRX8_9AGAM|nr:hypothetical protein EV702DRAFT_1269462 [Suillus placidus]